MKIEENNKKKKRRMKGWMDGRKKFNRYADGGRDSRCIISCSDYKAIARSRNKFVDQKKRAF